MSDAMTPEQRIAELTEKLRESEQELLECENILRDEHARCSRIAKEAVDYKAKAEAAEKQAEHWVKEALEIGKKFQEAERDRDQWKDDAKLRQQNSANEFAVLDAQILRADEKRLIAEAQLKNAQEQANRFNEQCGKLLLAIDQNPTLAKHLVTQIMTMPSTPESLREGKQ